MEEGPEYPGEGAVGSITTRRALDKIIIDNSSKKEVIIKGLAKLNIYCMVLYSTGQVHEEWK